MRTTLALLFLVAVPTLASADSFGSSLAACEMGPDAARSHGKVDGLYFDGNHLIGWEWGCDFSDSLTGQCSGLDEEWTETFSVAVAKDIAVITGEDGKPIELMRCPD